MIRSTITARVFAITVVILCLLAATVSRAHATIIGLDLADLAPDNWNSVTGDIISDLIDETGATTDVDVALNISGDKGGSLPVTAATKPIHNPDLANLGTCRVRVDSIEFSSLVPNASYQVWVLA